MFYKIVQDEKILKEFIDWLPELQPTEKFYMCLFARSKYSKNKEGENTLPHIKSDKAQLKRFVTDKERMFLKIKQLEIQLGWYQQKDLIVPQEVLALYITPNPREMWRASIRSMVKLAQCIENENKLMNPHQEVLSEIQRTKSRTCYIDFDIDAEGEELEKAKSLIPNVVNMDAVTLLQTRGGIHCLIDPNKVQKEFKNKFWKGMTEIPGVDQTGDGMIPVPGCCQGGFVPHFIQH